MLGLEQQLDRAGSIALQLPALACRAVDLEVAGGRAGELQRGHAQGRRTGLWMVTGEHGTVWPTAVASQEIALGPGSIPGATRGWLVGGGFCLGVSLGGTKVAGRPGSVSARPQGELGDSDDR